MAFCRHAAAVSGIGLTGFAGLFELHMPSRIVTYAEAQSGINLDIAGTAFIVGAIGFTAIATRRWWALTREVRQWRHAHRTARQLATRDPLTGLPNRRRLRAELALSLARMRRGCGPVGLLVLDLDRFSDVNNTHGRRTGDALLRDVAERLTRIVRENDVVARLDRDRFALIADMKSAEDAAILAERIRSEFTLPFASGPVNLAISCRIGISIAPDDANTPDTLLHNAETALQQASSSPGPVVRFFDQDMDERVRQRAVLAAALGTAVAQQDIGLHFQPIVELRSGRIKGFEALARWWLPSRGMVPPAEFIPAAERCGLIGPLTDMVLRKACLAGRSWPEDIAVSVNVSSSQMQDGSFPARVAAILRETGFAPDRLELDITESALLSNMEQARGIVAALKVMGVRLALDDFGTGWSSLRYLQAFPFDKIKIDGGFVHSMGAHTESAKIVASVIRLGRSLNIPTVAEGIETQAEADSLLRLGCALGQGWWLGRPIPAEAVDAIFEAAR